MKYFVGMLIGFGVGLVAASLVVIFSPFTETVTNFGLLGLGVGLFIGGLVALVALALQKPSPTPEPAHRPPASVHIREQP